MCGRGKTHISVYQLTLMDTKISYSLNNAPILFDKEQLVLIKSKNSVDSQVRRIKDTRAVSDGDNVFVHFVIEILHIGIP